MRPGPHQIDTTGAHAGDALVFNPATGEYGPGAAGVQTIIAGTYVTVDATDPHNLIVTAMVPLTTLNSSGLPEIVFDSDGHIVYTEAP